MQGSSRADEADVAFVSLRARRRQGVLRVNQGRARRPDGLLAQSALPHGREVVAELATASQAMVPEDLIALVGHPRFPELGLLGLRAVWRRLALTGAIVPTHDFVTVFNPFGSCREIHREVCWHLDSTTGRHRWIDARGIRWEHRVRTGRAARGGKPEPLKLERFRREYSSALEVHIILPRDAALSLTRDGDAVTIKDGYALNTRDHTGLGLAQDILSLVGRLPANPLPPDPRSRASFRQARRARR